MIRWTIVFHLVGLIVTAAEDCENLLKKFRHPCECGKLGNGRLLLNCDKVVFPNDLPNLPDNFPIVSYSQRFAGYQSLPLQLFAPAGNGPQF